MFETGSGLVPVDSSFTVSTRRWVRRKTLLNLRQGWSFLLLSTPLAGWFVAFRPMVFDMKVSLLWDIMISTSNSDVIWLPCENHGMLKPLLKSVDCQMFFLQSLRSCLQNLLLVGWFQPIWKIWVKLENLPQIGMNISKNIWVATT